MCSQLKLRLLMAHHSGLISEGVITHGVAVLSCHERHQAGDASGSLLQVLHLVLEEPSRVHPQPAATGACPKSDHERGGELLLGKPSIHIDVFSPYAFHLPWATLKRTFRQTPFASLLGCSLRPRLEPSSASPRHRHITSPAPFPDLPVRAAVTFVRPEEKEGS